MLTRHRSWRRPAAAALVVALMVVLPVPANGSRSEQEAGQSVRSRISQSLELADQDAPLPSPLVNLASLADDVWNRHYSCFAAYEATQVDICPLGDLEAERIVVAMGDSHIGQWLPTLDILGERRGFKVIPLIKLSCAPYDVQHSIAEVDGDYTQCDDFRSWAVRRIARWQPVAVVLAARVLAAGSDETSVEERAADWEQGVETGVRRLLRNGARSVRVLSDLPEVDQDPGSCLRQQGVTMATCVSSPDRRVTLGNRVVRTAARAGGAAYVDVVPLVCLRKRCPAVVGKIVTFRDNDHITITWAKAVAREFGGRLGVP